MDWKAGAIVLGFTVVSTWIVCSKRFSRVTFIDRYNEWTQK